VANPVIEPIEYITTDLDLAAFLISKEHELLDIRVGGTEQCSFVFHVEAAPLAATFKRGAHVVAQTYARHRYALLGLVSDAKAEARATRGLGGSR
jgi:hypothetical protein